MARIGDFITKNAFQRREAPAVNFQERVLTWAELENRCWAIAAAFHDLGIGQGDRIAYLGENSHRYFECYYAPSRIGAIFVPLNNRHALDEKIECVADCAPRALLVDRYFVEEAIKISKACTSIERLVYADDDPAPAGTLSYEGLIEAAGNVDPLQFDAIASEGDDTLILFYTGGTTGKAKGVMLSHHNLLINSIATTSLFGFAAGEVHLITGPMFHLGTGSRAFSAVYCGAQTLVLSGFNPEQMLTAIERHRINVVVLVPTMLKMVLDHPGIGDFDLSCLRLVCYGAAPMPLALIRRAVALLPGTEFVQSYGQTETSPVVSVLGPEYHDLNRPGIDKLKSVGRPVPYADVRIFDDDDQPLDCGKVGEVVLRGPQVMKGYWHKPALTAEAWRSGFHHTGDAGYFDVDGFLYIVGRTKDMIITGGENVYPVETENVLLQHPAVSESAVIGIPDQHWGETVHAIIRVKAGATIDEATLIAYCRKRLAHYKCPAGVTFRSEPMPLSSVNKIMKAQLRKPFLEDSSVRKR